MATRLPRRRDGQRRRLRGLPFGLERLETRQVLAGISGTVHQSIDVSGIDPNAPNVFGPQPGVVIRLNDGATTATTDSSGRYSFTNVPTGSHTVSVVLPEGFIGTAAQSLSYTVVVDTVDVDGLDFAIVDRNGAIAQNLFELVLQRSATFDEFTASTDRLDAGKPVASEFTRLLTSQEFRTVLQPVAGFVQAMFPGVLEIEMLRASGIQQRVGIDQDATIQGIMGTQQFVSAHGDVSQLANADYVRFLYRELLNRIPTPRQLSTGVTQLTAGKSRGQLALDVVATPAFQGRGQIRRSYQAAITYAGLLGREATATEVQSFARGIATPQQLAARLARTAEFTGLQGYTSTAIWDVQAMVLSPPVTPLDRLQQYNPATKAFDLPVTAGSITSSAASPKNVYFVSHGWCPGQSEAVLLGSTPGNPLKSWNPALDIPPWLFASTPQVASTGMAQTILDADPSAVVIAYSWIDLSATPTETVSTSVSLAATGTPATGLDPQTLTVADTSQLSAGMTVTGTGVPAGTTVESITSTTTLVIKNRLTQAITAETLTFAGVDLESTIRSLAYVGQSESRTQWAGLMLAEAIEEALADGFFGTGEGLLHILGHSHGAKVATVATVALEAANVPVSQLTLFDSPETGPTQPFTLAAPGIGGGQNFAWRFLQELPRISKTPVAIGRQATGGTFVDNYYSGTGFGAPFGGYGGLGTVVDVLLRPATLYNPSGSLAGDLGAAFPSHSYPPAWYAQASLQNPNASGDVKNGLYWSPLMHPLTTALLADSYDQFPQGGSTSPGTYVQRQFELAAGGAATLVTVDATPLVYGVQPTTGDVVDTGSSLTLSVDGDTPLSIATIGFVPYATDASQKPIGTGLELDVSFAGVDPGETVQLVVSIHGMAAIGLDFFGAQQFLSGTTGYTTMPMLTLDGGTSGAGPRMATLGLDGFRNQTLLQGGYASAANPVSQLVFSLIASPGSNASVTVSNMKQFGTPTR